LDIQDTIGRFPSIFWHRNERLRRKRLRSEPTPTVSIN